MVTFEDGKYIITVETNGNPVENWQMLHDSLCDLIRATTTDNINNETFYLAVDFMRELMPNWETAKKMTK